MKQNKVPKYSNIDEKKLIPIIESYNSGETYDSLTFFRVLSSLLRIRMFGLTLSSNLMKIFSRNICTISTIQEWNQYPVSVLETAKLAHHVYGNEPELPAGWSICSKFDDQIQFNNLETGLKSCLYQKTLSDGKDFYVYAIAGTKSSHDWSENIKQTIGKSTQYHLSLANGNKLASLVDPQRLMFVGHSLGGGEAANIAMENPESTARTFNSAGVSFWNNKKIIENHVNIEAFILKSDPLNFVQELLGEIPQTVGTRYYIPPVKKYSTKDCHGMLSMIESLSV